MIVTRRPGHFRWLAGRRYAALILSDLRPQVAESEAA